jgi:hypothetical protein
MGLGLVGGVDVEITPEAYPYPVDTDDRLESKG